VFGGVPHDIQSTLAHLNEKERNCARPGSTAPTPRRATNGAGFGHKKAPTLPACSVISSMSPRASMAAEGFFSFLRGNSSGASRPAGASASAAFKFVPGDSDSDSEM
jgi:hypothetical protein